MSSDHADQTSHTICACTSVNVFTRAYIFPIPLCMQVKQHLQTSGHSIVYAEDILRLNDAVAKPGVETETREVCLCLSSLCPECNKTKFAVAEMHACRVGSGRGALLEHPCVSCANAILELDPSADQLECMHAGR